jgi:Flp pilus assembly pilin Flp
VTHFPTRAAGNTRRGLLRRLLHRTDGGDVVEYALISTFIALAVYFGVTWLGTALTNMNGATSNVGSLGAPCTIADAVANVGQTTCASGGGGTGGGGGTTTGGGGSTTGGGGSTTGGGGTTTGGGGSTTGGGGSTTGGRGGGKP